MNKSKKDKEVYSREDFNKMIDIRVQQIKDTLISKQGEYSRNNNALHNFERGGDILGISRERCILSYATKHLTSIFDLVNDLEEGNAEGRVTKEIINEKVGDMINYLILLEASLYNSIS